MKEIILDNGLKLLYKKTFSKLTSICIAVDAGAIREDKKLGLAHATEHLLYKGTKKRTEEEINKELTSLFGFQNAMTNYPYVIYYGTLLEDDFSKGLELFSDIIINPSLDKEGFDEELEIIKEELLEWDDDLEQFCEDKLFFNSFNKNRLKYPIIGKNSDLESMTIDDVREFYNENYFPQNTTIAVVTSLELNEIKDTVEMLFSNWKSNKSKKDNIKFENNINGTFTDIRESGKISRIQLIASINKLNEKEIKAFRVFNEFFGEGVNSVLYDVLRTKNSLVYDVLTKISRENGINLYKLNVNTSKEKLNEVKEKITFLIENIDKYLNQINEKNIIDYVKSIKLKRLFREEQGIVLAKELSSYSVMFNNSNIYNDEIEELENITIEDIRNVAKKVFENYSIQIIKNRNKKD